MTYDYLPKLLRDAEQIITQHHDLIYDSVTMPGGQPETEDDINELASYADLAARLRIAARDLDRDRRDEPEPCEKTVNDQDAQSHVEETTEPASVHKFPDFIASATVEECDLMINALNEQFGLDDGEAA